MRYCCCRALPFKIPYPVPFKLLGDETKGWIDVTYMNREGSFRLTRGNKGTLFVLIKPEAKETTPVEALLAAVHAGADDDSVMKLALQLKVCTDCCIFTVMDSVLRVT